MLYSLKHDKIHGEGFHFLIFFVDALFDSLYLIFPYFLTNTIGGLNKQTFISFIAVYLPTIFLCLKVFTGSIDTRIYAHNIFKYKRYRKKVVSKFTVTKKNAIPKSPQNNSRRQAIGDVSTLELAKIPKSYKYNDDLDSNYDPFDDQQFDPLTILQNMNVNKLSQNIIDTEAKTKKSQTTIYSNSALSLSMHDSFYDMNVDKENQLQVWDQDKGCFDALINGKKILDRNIWKEQNSKYTESTDKYDIIYISMCFWFIK